MTGTSTTKGQVHAQGGAAESYGLHAGALGPVETLAQSVSAMAPSNSASLTIPLLFALAGNATWFVYLLASSHFKKSLQELYAADINIPITRAVAGPSF